MFFTPCAQRALEQAGLGFAERWPFAIRIEEGAYATADRTTYQSARRVT
jgi:hypothetical protein